MTKKVSEMSSDELKHYQIQREKNKLRMRATYAERASNPKFKAKQAAANKRWHQKTGYSKRADVKKKNAKRMTEKYQTDEEYRLAQRRYWEVHRNKPEIKTVRLEKQRVYGRDYKKRKRLDAEYSLFLERIDQEALSCSE